MYKTGDFLVFQVEEQTPELYDFGYYGTTGKIIVYIHGEMNGQDSYAIEPKYLRLATKEDLERYNWSD